MHCPGRTGGGGGAGCPRWTSDGGTVPQTQSQAILSMCDIDCCDCRVRTARDVARDVARHVARDVAWLSRRGNEWRRWRDGPGETEKGSCDCSWTVLVGSLANHGLGVCPYWTRPKCSLESRADIAGSNIRRTNCPEGQKVMPLSLSDRGLTLLLNDTVIPLSRMISKWLVSLRQKDIGKNVCWAHIQFQGKNV